MIPSLPLDLLQIILENVDDKQSLTRCCSTSKIMLALARPVLYHDIEVVVRRRMEGIRPEAYDPEDYDQVIVRPIYELLGKSGSLLLSIAAHMHLGALVRSVSFANESGEPSFAHEPEEDKRTFTSIKHWMDVLHRIRYLVPAAESITILNPDSVNRLDDFVRKMQRDELGCPSFHLSLVGDHYHFLGQLSAVYASLEVVDDAADNPLNDDDDFGPISWPIAKALTSLKLESSDNFGQFSLESFSALQRLELVSVEWHGRIRVGSRKTDQTLSSLRDLTSLETLVLSGGPCETSNYLFTPGRLGDSIPPCVSSLEIDIEVVIVTLLELISSLPLSTGIKKFIVRTRIEDVTELKEICQGKGIKLVVV